MGKEMRWMAVLLVVLVAGYFINSFQQGKYNASSDRIFNIDQSDIFSLEISKDNESVKLSFDGESWEILDHDSLTVKANTINSFFTTILTLEKTSLVSKNPANWHKFMVDDSSGAKLKFLDFESKVLSEVVVGRSNAEWSSSNIRIGDQPEVYHTSENISWQINPSPTYWGEVVQADSISLETKE